MHVLFTIFKAHVLPIGVQISTYSDARIRSQKSDEMSCLVKPPSRNCTIQIKQFRSKA